MAATSACSLCGASRGPIQRTIAQLTVGFSFWSRVGPAFTARLEGLRCWVLSLGLRVRCRDALAIVQGMSQDLCNYVDVDAIDTVLVVPRTFNLNIFLTSILLIAFNCPSYRSILSTCCLLERTSPNLAFVTGVFFSGCAGPAPVLDGHCSGGLPSL